MNKFDKIQEILNKTNFYLENADTKKKVINEILDLITDTPSTQDNIKEVVEFNQQEYPYYDRSTDTYFTIQRYKDGSHKKIPIPLGYGRPTCSLPMDYRDQNFTTGFNILK